MSKIVIKQKLTATSTTAQEQDGKAFVDYSNGKKYRYGKFKDVTHAANDVVEYSSSTSDSLTAFTGDRAGGTSIGRTVAGVAQAANAANTFGWVQTEGKTTVKVPAGGVVAAGDLLAPHATSDGAVVKATTSTFRSAFAVALSADTATTSAAGTCRAQLIRV